MGEELMCLLHNSGPIWRGGRGGVTAPESKRKRPRHTPLFLLLMSWLLPLSWGPPAKPQLSSGTSPSFDQGVAGSLALRWSGTPVDF